TTFCASACSLPQSETYAPHSNSSSQLPFLRRPLDARLEARQKVVEQPVDIGNLPLDERQDRTGKFLGDFNERSFIAIRPWGHAMGSLRFERRRRAAFPFQQEGFVDRRDVYPERLSRRIRSAEGEPPALL